MKIMMVHNTYQFPGGEDVVFENERSILLHRGHRVVTYCRSNTEISEMSLARRIVMLRTFISSEQAKQEVLELLKREKPDIVHVYNTFTMITPSIYDSCQEANIPVVQALQNYRLVCPTATLFRSGRTCVDCQEKGVWQSVLHGCYRNSRLISAAAALSLAAHRKRSSWDTHVDAYVAPSEFVRQKLAEAAIPDRRIFLKPNFVSQDPGVRSSLGSYALFVGRLSVEKGLSTLLRAWKQLQMVLKLHIVGDGPLRQQLEAEISQNDLSNVQLMGWLDRKRVQEAMKDAKFLIFPSEWFEPFGQTIVEAFACGVPVIGSRLGAVEELISDGRTGLLFAPGNAGDLALKIDWAWRHPREIAEMGRFARREYEAKYTAAINYTQLMAIYDRVLKDRNSITSSGKPN